jgi:PAS domain S-box-containing protein
LPDVLFVQDPTGGIYIEVPVEDLGLKAGDLVEVKGVTGQGWFANQIEKPEVQVLGRAPLPEPRHPRFEEIALGQEDSQWVEIAGIVHSTRIELPSKNLILSLVVGSGRLTVAVRKYPESAPTQLLDSKIQVLGACGGVFNPKRQLVGIVINVQDINLVRILEPSTLSAETPPVESIRDLARLSARTTSGHRVKVRGIVTLQQPTRALYIKDATESLKVETSQATAVQPGDEVEVWGFTAWGEGVRKLEDAEFRKLGSGPPPVPVDITVDDAVQGTYDGSLVRLKGRIFKLLNEGDPPSLLVASGQVAFRAQVLGKGSKAALSRLQVGSRVAITGVCEVLADGNGAPPAFRLLVRSPDDLEVLEKASWWNLQRTHKVLGLAGALILAIAGWVIMLRKQVRAKTGEIREWLRREAALTDRYRDLLENAIDMVYTRDLQGNFTSVNNTTVSALGYTRQELLGMNIVQVVAPEHRDSMRRAVDSAGDRESSGDIGLEVITKGGARLAVEIRGRPLYEDGKAVGVQGIARDITQRLQAEEALRQSEEKYRTIVLNIPDVVWTIDSQGHIVFISPNIERLGGYTAEEVCQGGVDLHFQTMHPDDVPKVREVFAAAFRDPQPREVEYRGQHKDGSWIWVRLRTMRAYEKDGSQYLQGLLSDVTAWKQAEQTLALAEEKYRSLVLNIPDVAWTVDSTGQLTFVSPNIEKLSGFNATEIVQDGVRLFRGGNHPDAAKARASLQALFSRGEAYDVECRIQRKSGEWTWVHDRAVATYEKNGVRYADGLLSDITERKRAEEALRESELFNREVIASAQEGVVVYDRDFRYQVWNPFMEELTGVPAAESLGKHGFEIFPHLGGVRK